LNLIIIIIIIDFQTIAKKYRFHLNFSIPCAFLGPLNTAKYMFICDDDYDRLKMYALKLQENGRQRNLSFADATSGHYVADDRYASSTIVSQTGSSSSPSGGLACAIAALAERQQMSGESSVSSNNENSSSFNMPPGSRRFYNRLGRDMVSYSPSENLNEGPPDDAMTMTRSHGEWSIDHGSQVAETTTSYANSVEAEDHGELSSLSQSNDIGSFQSATDPIVPESFEEQMMLAMAVSLAEARAMPSGQSASWQ
jgi:hypothetical protein